MKNGKVVWITGASSGIGESLAYELSNRGYSLILSARRESTLIKVKDNCRFSENTKVLPLDLEKYESFNEHVKEAVSMFGKIDILVNNGGLSQRSLAIDTIIDVDKKIMQINYLGTVALTKAILPHFNKRSSGQVVTVTSMVGKFGTPLRSTYAASKHALHGFMDSLRAEVSKDNIFVSLVCPGFVATDVSLNALTGSGESQGTMDKATSAGMDPRVFAKKMADSIEAKKDEVYIAGLKELFGLYLDRFFPALFRKLVKKMSVT